VSRRALRAACTAGVLGTLLLGAATGCGGDSTPTSQVPALQARLDAVDQAVAGGQPAAVRRAVDRLEHTAYDAERSGELAGADAAAIVSAGDALVAALPAPRQPSATTSAPAPSPTPTPQETRTPEPSGHDKPEKEPKPPKGPGPGHDHGHGHGHEH
jgi:hypothetical protein